MDRSRASTRRWWIEAAIIALAAAGALVPVSPEVIERWYSTGVYPRLQQVLTPLSNLLAVSWLDVLALVTLAWLAWIWWRALRQSENSRRRVRLGRAARATFVAAALIYLGFLALWGFNYRRVPMTARLVVDRPAPRTDDVARLGFEAASRVNALYARAHTSGWTEPVWRNIELRRAYGEVQRMLTVAPDAVPGRLKRSIFGPFFRWTSVDGMVNPFGLEVLANPDLLPFERPFVAAHEWAHLAGYADESEANFVGWLTCLHADVASQYSGWLYLYWQVAGELPPAERRQANDALAEGPRRDLAAIAGRLRRGDVPALRRVSWKVYDQYLKANRVDAGVRSYGAVVTLILRARFSDGWRPVRRAVPSAPSTPSPAPPAPSARSPAPSAPAARSPAPSPSSASSPAPLRAPP